jgi:predicted outer membrane protein
MKRLTTILFATLTVGQGSAGCATSSSSSSPLLTPSLPTTVTAAHTTELQAYISSSTSFELLSIQSAEVALRRSTDGRVRSAAARSLLDHNGLSAQLAFAGRRLNILPPRTLHPSHQRMLGHLINSTNVDQAYVAQQRSVSKAAFQLHSRYLQSGNSSTLRGVAQFAVSVFAADLKRFRRL